MSPLMLTVLNRDPPYYNPYSGAVSLRGNIPSLGYGLRTRSAEPHVVRPLTNPPVFAQKRAIYMGVLGLGVWGLGVL